MASEESFLARWSRRKRADAEARAAEERPADSRSAPPADTPEMPTDAGPPSPPDLPPVETLDRNSDYTVFLRAGVPDAVRREALRKLWTSDPVLANLDGLLEYGEDFRASFVDPGVVKTLYRVGEGMRDALEEAAEPSAAEGASPAEASSAPTTDSDPDRARGADDGKSGAV